MSSRFEILIVDDDAALASNLQHILETEGYRTTAVPDGQAALALAREKAFDLALVDIKLPDIPGLKLSQKLTKISPGTNCIISTGYASLETAVEAIRQR